MAVILLILSLLLASGSDSQLEKLPCELCTESLSIISQIVLSDSFISIGKSIAIFFCSIFVNHSMCSGYVNLYALPLVNSFSENYLNTQRQCFLQGHCESPVFEYEDFTLFTQEVLQDQPPVEPWPIQVTSTFKILQISDLHVDWQYMEGSSQSCWVTPCCRTGTGSAGKWGSLSGCDIPPITFQAMVEQISSLDVDFVVWTGDNPPHDQHNYTRESSLEILFNLTTILQEYLEVPVYPSLGNHDCFPMDLFKPDQESQLLNNLAILWSPWLDQEAILEFQENGYYSYKDPKTGLRILSLNTQLADNLNFYMISNNTDPGQMINWIWTKLQLAEALDEKVLIIGHIPNGGPFSSSVWSEHYRVLANRYQNTIIGQIFGHTHNDEFRIIHPVGENLLPAGIILVAPSLTTFYELNPSFRVYQLDSESKRIVDIHQYRLDLDKANKNPSQKPIFEKVYEQKQNYGMKDLSALSFVQLSDRILNDEKTSLNFNKNFYTTYMEQTSCDQTCRKISYCKIQSDIFEDNYQCKSGGFANHFFKFLESLSPYKWLYKV